MHLRSHAWYLFRLCRAWWSSSWESRRHWRSRTAACSWYQRMKRIWDSGSRWFPGIRIKPRTTPMVIPELTMDDLWGEAYFSKIQSKFCLNSNDIKYGLPYQPCTSHTQPVPLVVWRCRREGVMSLQPDSPPETVGSDTRRRMGRLRTSEKKGCNFFKQRCRFDA